MSTDSLKTLEAQLAASRQEADALRAQLAAQPGEPGQAVQRSEARFRALVTATSQIIWTAAADGQVEDMPQWRAYTGQTVEAHRGWGWLEAVHPDDRARAAETWTRATANRSVYEVDYRIRRHDGLYRWFSVRGVPVVDAAGTVEEWVGACTDIEDRYEAEAAERRQEARLRTLAEASRAFAEAGVEVRPLAEGIARRVAEAMGDMCVVALLSEDRLRRDFTLFHHPDARLHAEITATMANVTPPTDTGLAAEVLRQGKELFLPHLELAEIRDRITPALVPFFEREGLYGLLTVPIRAHGEVIGLVCLHRHAPRTDAYSDDDRQLVRDLADRAGMAIANARLLENLERRVEERTAELNVANEELTAQTEELQSQQDELQASQTILQGVLDSATSGILACEAVRDEAGRITDFRFTLANPMSEKMVFHTASEMVGNTLLTLFPGNIESGLFDGYCHVTETGEPWEVDTFYRDDRLEFWLNVSAVKVDDGVAITFTDITARKRAEVEMGQRAKELVGQKAFAESIIQNVPAGICYLDRDLYYRIANPVLCEFLQLPAERIVDHHLAEVVTDGADQLEPLLRNVMATRTPLEAKEYALTYTVPGGGLRHSFWDFVYLPLVLETGGEVEGVLVFAEEVSDRVEREREQRQHREEVERLQHERIETLEQTDKLKDQFLSILSHELRTPINAIMGFGSVLDDEVPGPLSAEQRLYTGRILTSADTLLALIDDLLVVSRVQAGKFSVTPQPTDLPALIAFALETLAPAARTKAIQVLDEVPPGLPTVVADAQRIGQVITNLVGNAVKFTPEGGAVRVRAHRLDGHLRIEVTDTGSGIAPGDQLKLFRPFSQLDMSNTRQAAGTGLGLSIVKAIVEAHGGHVGVESAPGRGSTFWFTLPVSA